MEQHFDQINNPAVEPEREEKLPVSFPLLALRGLVVFPSMLLHFDVVREKSISALEAALAGNRRIFLAAQRDLAVEDPGLSDLYRVGVVAEVRQVLKMPDNSRRVLVEGLYRARICELLASKPHLMALVSEYPMGERKITPAREDAMLRILKKELEHYCSLVPKMPREMIEKMMTDEDASHLTEYVAGNLMLPMEAKQYLLEQSDPLIRMEDLIHALREESDVLALEQEIEGKVRDRMDDNQREYYLREQMKVISEELGEGEDPAEEALTYKMRILSLELPKESQEKLLSEVEKLGKMPGGSHEGSVIRNYLDTCLALPWNKSGKEVYDVKQAEKVLERDHYGLEKVKERILEFVAVRKFAPDLKGQIICLAGPPGVGKTSIARSLAEAVGRKYVRVSLGGVRDESEIRGHRKTYIGAMPGRIIDAIRQAGVNNPLILLDEIDKMGNDFKGDPSSAMLEVLDAEQNSSFRDHYIELPFDLSKVMFVTTANDVSAIPAPLYDRMEVVELSSYTREEKFRIAKQHLLRKQLKKHGLNAMRCRISDEALFSLIDFYVKEAGVRKLERTIASLCRKAAKKLATEESVRQIRIGAKDLEGYLGPKKYKEDALPKEDRIGCVTGLAWTSVGGVTMEIEAASLPGDGKLSLTGSLGDVMQESAKTAISYVRQVADRYHIPADFYKTRDLHLHAPEGATPKDGPSAGVTFATALISELSGIPVRRDVAMTGEISLKGRVMAIGGLKEKAMAAYAMGIKTVIIPEENLPDLQEVDEVVKSAVEFIPASKLETVLKYALVIPEEPLKKEKAEVSGNQPIMAAKSRPASKRPGA